MPVENIPPTADPLAELPQKISIDLDSLLKAIRTGDKDRIAKPIHDAARARLRTREFRRAGFTMDASKAHGKTPKGGSENINLRGVLRWIEDVKVDDPEELEKLQIVHATAEERMK